MLSTSRTLWPILVFFLLSCLFLWRIFAGEVFVPAELLRHVAPWSAQYSEQERPPWNPLMYDSVGQFYPWRKFASESMRSGTIPLWNPYQFCGTPFIANSQSAVLYPGNLLFYLLPVAHAAGWTVILHLTLAAAFMWLLVRALGAPPAAAALSGVAFAFSTWQVSWLHLPTFLATSCWLPLVMLLVMRLFERPCVHKAAGLGFAIGMTLLAGHLQIAFYVLLAAVTFTIWLAAQRIRREGQIAKAIGCIGCAFVLGGMISAPQLLPTLELSRYSHRAGAATESGFQAYRDYAVSGESLALMVFPEIFGNPSNPRNPYFGTSAGEIPFNYAENALYAGSFTLLLALFALLGRAESNLRAYFAFLAALALLMALGTWVSRALYFSIPGFASSGSPGRALVLFAFATSALAGIGCAALLDRAKQLGSRDAAAVILFAALAGLLYAIGIAGAGKMGGDPSVVRAAAVTPQLGILALAVLAFLFLPRFRERARWSGAIPVALVTIDLFANGIHYNPTAKADEVYPLTKEIQALKQAGHDRILPVNSNWSFGGPAAVLPPNGAAVFGLRDVQGYDSLFPGQYKAFLNRTLGQDASPPEVGNMVFAKRADLGLANLTGARFLVAIDPSGPRIQDLFQLEDHGVRAKMTPQGRIEWREDGPTRVKLTVQSDEGGALRLADQFYPGWTAAVDGKPADILRADGIFRRVAVPPGRHTVAFQYLPAGFRAGLYLLLASVLLGGVFLGMSFTRKKDAVSTV